VDWWAPAGTAGDVELALHVDARALERILATGDGGPLTIAMLALAGAEVRLVVEHGRLAAYAGPGDEPVAALTLPPGGGRVLGRDLTLDLREDAGRGSRLHGPKREWVAGDGAHTWVWDTRKPTTVLPRLVIEGVETVTAESEPVTDEDRERLVSKRLRLRWVPSARPVDVVLHALVVSADLRQALHGRIGRGLRTTFSVTGLVLDLLDDDGEVTSRARHRVSRSPGAAPPPDPPGPSSAR
jgi:hypothetical protein